MCDVQFLNYGQKVKSQIPSLFFAVQINISRADSEYLVQNQFIRPFNNVFQSTLFIPITSGRILIVLQLQRQLFLRT